MPYRHPDDTDRFESVSEAIAGWARAYGEERKDQAWLLHDFDVWVANPHYRGPAVPHPEEEPWDTDGDTSKWNENGEGSEAENDRYASRANPVEYDPDDEIPF